MANGGRRVVIDDTHPRIVYSTNPPWLLDASGLMDNVGNFGQSLNTTLHGTSANGSFSFTFSGTAIDIYGTNNIRNSSGVIDPVWNCYLNGVQIKSSPAFRYQENNWRMCGVDGLLDMNHTFTLTVSTSGQTFWFDYLTYTPSPNTTLQNDSVVLVPFTDSSFVYFSSWQFWSNISALTRTFDAGVQVKFTGTSLSWYGIYPRELALQPALATFSIDGGKENTFRLQGLSANSPTAYNQLLFRTDIYPHGPHTITVDFKGNNNTTPLSLSYVLLQSSNTSPKVTTPTTIATAEEGSAARPPISIAGLVCSVVALLIIFVVLLAYFRRKRAKAKLVPNALPASPAPTVPIRLSTATAPRFDLASSSPYLGVEGAIAEDHSRRSTWHEKLRTSFSAAFSRAPHLGMVIANGSTTDHRKQPRPPQILSLWARRNLSRQSHQRLPDETVPHRPQMPPYHHQGQRHQALPMTEHLPGRPESRNSVAEHSGGNIPSLSLPSAPSATSAVAGHGRTASSADASYYGGYRTKRDMIELERRQQG